MGEEAQFVARYASVVLTGNSFTEVGDVLAARGFDMVSARQTEQGVLVIPHTRQDRQSAHVFQKLPVLEPEMKPLDTTSPLDAPSVLTPMSLGAAQVELVTAKIESGVVEPIPLTCGTCGAVHPEGAICMIPIFYERTCCTINTYAHVGPHEAATGEGVIIYRWVEELKITDLPFNGYHPLPPEDGDCA